MAYGSAKPSQVLIMAKPEHSNWAKNALLLQIADVLEPKVTASKFQPFYQLPDLQKITSTETRPFLQVAGNDSFRVADYSPSDQPTLVMSANEILHHLRIW